MADNSKKPLLPAYLIVGEDALKQRTVLERLRTRVAGIGDISFNHDRFEGESASGDDIVSACNTLPFASEVRLVEVSHADKLRKQAADALTNYLASPSETTVLAVSAQKLPKNTRLYKAIAALGSHAVIDCTPLRPRELEPAIRSMAVGHGFAMTPSAAHTLIELVGEDTVRIDTELRKLATAHTGNDAVTDHEVRMLVAHTAEVKPWDFTNAFAARDLARCLAMMPHLDTTPHVLIGRCVNQIRELICAKTLDSRGEGARIADELGGPPWRYKNHIRWSRGFAPGELERALISARDCEREMKSGADPEIAFKQWLVTVLAK